MALKRWYETMNANDCLEDNVTFNDMTNYIKHSSCTDLTIYSTCSDTGQAFRFTQAGTMSTSYGGTNAGDDRRWRANDADTYPYIEGLGGSHLKFYTGNDIYFYDNAVKMSSFTYAANKSYLTGGAATGDDLILKANDTNTYPYIELLGDSHIKLYSSDDVYFYDDATEEFRFYDNSVDIKGDRAIYVNDDETYIGHGAGDNTTGINNTFIGHNTGNINISGTHNSAIGMVALASNTSGLHNSALGYAALHSNTEGDDNVAIGYGALLTNTVGSSNTALGYRAGYSTANISGNICIGYEAGFNNATNNRLYINNSNSAYPLIYGEFDNDIVKFGDNNAHFFFKFSHDANDAIVETEAANRSIYLKPQGTGLVKFGTYAGKGAEAFAGFITMEDSSGTARKIMVCA